MSSNPEKKRKLEDKDEHCRLRYGLNVQCLAHIFQYLDSPDLYTVGEMNDFYHQIINHFVIQNHNVNFEQLFERRVRLQQVFERYGTQIRSFSFCDLTQEHTTAQLLQSITRYCSVDQLRTVEIKFWREGSLILPIQFRKVKKLKIHKKYSLGNLSADFSESLHYLYLGWVRLDTEFDWNRLTNVTELYLYGVHEINLENFIAFLSQRPNLRVFHHDENTFRDCTNKICAAMANYCGNTIQDYSGKLGWNEDMSAPRIDMYSFISELKNVKKVRLMTHQICGGDLINGMKRLAENDTIETLEMKYYFHEAKFPLQSCIFQERPYMAGSDMAHFSHLKTVKLVGFDDPNYGEYCEHATICEPFKIFSLYGSRILPNVENLTVDFVACDWTIIESASKLRRLELFVAELTTMEAAQISSILENILQERTNGQNNGDSIEINFKEKYTYNLFYRIYGRNGSIKLSLV